MRLSKERKNLRVMARLDCLNHFACDITGDVFYYCKNLERYTDGISYCRRSECPIYEEKLDEIEEEIRDRLNELD